MRHSCGTPLLAVGTPLADVAKRLGESPTTRLTIYAHTSVDAEERESLPPGRCDVENRAGNEVTAMRHDEAS